MSISAPEQPRARKVRFTKEELVVELEDGRILAVPMEWFPRLRDAAPEELAEVRLIGQGVGLHWPGLDEDLSVSGLLMPSTAGMLRTG